MYIDKKHFCYYESDGTQHESRGLFLLVLDPHGQNEGLRAIVRKVAFQQLGNFMFGRANIGGKWYTVTDTFMYGKYADPDPIFRQVYDRALPLPTNIESALYAHDYDTVSKWALEHLAELR